MIRSLVMVSAGLGHAGGGRAAAGRLFAGGAARYCSERALAFSVLSLGDATEPSFSADTRHFSGSRRGLATATLAAQGKDTALLFDLLGLARIEAPLPAAWRPRYLVALFGIEVWRPLSWAHRRALRGAIVLAAISRHTLERALPYTGELGQATVLPLALEEPPDPPAPDPASVAETPGYLLMVGRMAASERYKGHDLMLDALPGLLSRMPNTRLVIAGDGDDRGRLEARAKELGVAERVTFTGFVTEARLRRLYRDAAAFVMPSTGEGFGLVYLEAMREGVPCVAARGSVAEEVLEDGTSGLLVSPTDAAELTAVLASLLADRALRERVGEAGRTRFATLYTRERFNSNLSAILDRLTDAAATAPDDVRH